MVTRAMLLAALALCSCDAGGKSDLPPDEPEVSSAGTSSAGTSTGGTGSATGGSATGGSPASTGTCQRPAEKAAITLTYDDSLPSHVINAARRSKLTAYAPLSSSPTCA